MLMARDLPISPEVPNCPIPASTRSAKLIANFSPSQKST